MATEWKSLITNVDWKIVIDCLKSLLFHSATYKWSGDVLYHSLVFTSSCGWIEEQILETIIKIRRGIKRPDTESIFQLLTMDAAINITMEDTKEKDTF